MSEADKSMQVPDEEFEIIHSQSTDDLSSITSGTRETDDESDAHDSSGQADSNITLQMPQVEEYLEMAEFAAEDSELKPDLITHWPESHGSSQKHETCTAPWIPISIPVMYSGPVEYQNIVKHKFAMVLKSPAARIEMYRDKSGIKHGKPALIVEVLVSGVQPDESSNTPHLVILAPGRSETCFLKSPALLQMLSSNKSCDEAGAQANRALTWEEFTTLQPEALADPLVKCGEIWQEESHQQKLSDACLKQARTRNWLIGACLTLGTCLLYLVSQGSSGFVDTATQLPRANNTSLSRFHFHQLTETNALIELPRHIRIQTYQNLPNVSATVKRNGVDIESRLNAIVDNLYSLAWSNSDAYGELLIIAQASHAKYVLKDAYAVQYTANKPFLQTVIDKVKELHNLGHLAGTLTSQGIHEIVRQIEETRPQVANMSSHQLQVLKENGSQGLKFLRATYDQAAQMQRQALARLAHKSAHWSRGIQHLSVQQISNARKGALRLTDQLWWHRKSAAAAPTHSNWSNFVFKRGAVHNPTRKRS